MYKKVTMNLFFNVFLESTIEGLFTLIISSYLNIRTLEKDSFGEIVGSFLSLYYLIFSILVVVICNIWVIST
jgi:hypothetical protein